MPNDNRHNPRSARKGVYALSNPLHKRQGVPRSANPDAFICGECGGQVVARADGALRGHRTQGYSCIGGGFPPGPPRPRRG